MSQQTCAACDCLLDQGRIAVTIAGEVVEACCEDCAVALKEAAASIGAERVPARTLRQTFRNA